MANKINILTTNVSATFGKGVLTLHIRGRRGRWNDHKMGAFTEVDIDFPEWVVPFVVTKIGTAVQKRVKKVLKWQNRIHRAIKVEPQDET